MEASEPMIDVYKRQTVDDGFLHRLQALLAAHNQLTQAENEVGLEGPVSYTHLDVYKRQVFIQVVLLKINFS